MTSQDISNKVKALATLGCLLAIVQIPVKTYFLMLGIGVASEYISVLAPVGYWATLGGFAAFSFALAKVKLT